MTYAYLIRLFNFFNCDAEGFSDALSISRVSLQTIVDMTDFYELRSVTHSTGGILEKYLLLGRAHQAEDLTRLSVIIAVVLAEIPVVRGSRQFQGRILVFGLFLPLSKAVGLIANGRAGLPVHAHLPVTMGGIRRSILGPVDRDLVGIYTQA